MESEAAFVRLQDRGVKRHFQRIVGEARLGRVGPLTAFTWSKAIAACRGVKV
jgi:hypothetical protein